MGVYESVNVEQSAHVVGIVRVAFDGGRIGWQGGRPGFPEYRGEVVASSCGFVEDARTDHSGGSDNGDLHRGVPFGVGTQWREGAREGSCPATIAVSESPKPTSWIGPSAWSSRMAPRAAATSGESRVRIATEVTGRVVTPWNHRA